MVFAREVPSGPLAGLVKEIEQATKKKNIKAFVTVLTDDEGAKEKLEQFAEKNKIKNTVLSIDNPPGPKGWNIAKDAHVTVVLYNKRKVEANFAFEKGEVNKQAVQRVVGAIPKIASE